MKLKKQILSILATGAVLLNTTVPAFAGTTLVITGNGADSNNTTEVKMENTQTVVQSNNAEVENKIKAEAETGDNEANKNSGNVEINTGDAKTDVSVQNTLNSNAADLNCCINGDVDVEISGNLADSDNNAKLDLKNETFVGQTNEADVDNDVKAEAETGDNEANENGNGDVEVKTGDATSKVQVATTANANSAMVGGGQGEAGSMSLKILNNGADSDNDLKLAYTNGTDVVQSNEAEVENKVEAEAETGDNEANENGGDVLIDTGDATADVTIDNMVNFNWADVDCGCLLDVLAKIANNGADSQNEIKAELSDELEVFQDNCGDENKLSHWDWWRERCEVENEVEAEAETGDNDSKENNANQGGDPQITTGDATAKVDVANAGYSNVYGGTPDIDWPDHLGGLNLNLTLDLSDLLALLGL